MLSASKIKIVFLTVSLLFFSCGGASSASSSSSSESSSVVFETQALSVRTGTAALNLTVEIADTSEKRTQGLMNRSSLDSDAGMLFIFDTEQVLSFWMKDTSISLDIIFINSQKQIVYIQENTTPFSLDRISSVESSLYALEVNAGYVSQNNINVGDTVSF